MATVTPNFNWPVPTSTDLVKDGATAIEALGDSIDASLVDLKGGTTGQVLSKNSNTDMDFTWVTDAAGDITGVTAGTGITGGGTSGTVTVSFDQANFGGGQLAGAKNKILNSNLSIWQRGTSFTGTTLGAYCADRWGYYRGGAAGGATWSRQAAVLTGFQYSLRAQRDSGNTSTQYLGTWQSIETANSIPFAGQTVTLSFYAKCGANYSATSSALVATVITGTGTDQAIYSFTGSTNAVTGTATLTTSWQRFTYTGALGSSITQIGVQFIGTPTGTAGANDWYEITGVQLEQGTTATPFQTATGDIGSELAACQRYCVMYKADVTYNRYAGGLNYSTTKCNGNVFLPVEMRTAPSLTTTGTAANYAVNHGADVITACSAVPAINGAGSSNKVASIDATVASGLTAGSFGTILSNNNTTSYLLFTAEL